MLTKTDILIKEATSDTGIVLEDEHYEVAHAIIRECASIVSYEQSQVILKHFELWI